jgi:gluconate 2-dehydrogenase alpha chain
LAAPVWRSQWKAFIPESAAHHVTSYHQTNTFPYETTYLDLDPEVRDPLGEPVIRITSPMRENGRRATEYSPEKMEEWFRAAGAIEVRRQPVNPPGISNHAYGRTRMGDTETSVVNRWASRMRFPIWSILDGSVMVTSGAHNPTHGAGARLAHGRAFGEELEIDRRLTLWAGPSRCACAG